TFEVDTPASFAGPSSVPVTLAPQTALAVDDAGNPQSVLLSGRVSGIRAGDQLLLVGKSFAGSGSNWSLATVGSLAPAAAPGRGTTNPVAAFPAGGGAPPPPPPPPAREPGARPAREYRRAGPAGAAALWSNQAAIGINADQVVITKVDHAT